MRSPRSERLEQGILRGIKWEMFKDELFNLAKMVVSGLHKYLECKVEELKYKKLEVT